MEPAADGAIMLSLMIIMRVMMIGGRVIIKSNAICPCPGDSTVGSRLVGVSVVSMLLLLVMMMMVMMIRSN